MNGNLSNALSDLDRIRKTEGIEACKTQLQNLLQKDLRRAASWLNDQRLTFPCLYFLEEPLRNHRIRSYLNVRNGTALQLIGQVKDEKVSELDTKQNGLQPVLKWIWETGASEDVFEDDYAEILDLTASVLIGQERETGLLPGLVDLIFRRNRRGSHIHDLTWVLFRPHEPQVLELLARRLNEADAEDAALAAELLNLEEAELPEKEQEGYLRWLEENRPYLYFTEEGFQYSSRPRLCTVDLERKFLQKGTNSYEKQPLSDLEPEERESLEAFRLLDEKEQKILSGYSQSVHDKSLPAWKKWLRAPAEEQIQAAKTGGEGRLWL